MKKFILATIFSFSLLFYSLPIMSGNAIAATCVGETYDAFTTRMKSRSFEVLTLGKNDITKFLTFLEAKGVTTQGADNIVFAFISKEEVGVAFFKEGCLLPESVTVMPAILFIQLLDAAQIKGDGILKVSAA